MPGLNEMHKFPVLINSVTKSKKGISSAMGKNILLQRLRKIGELAPNNQPIEISRLLLIKKGETVPSVFRNLSALKLDASGVAKESYTDGWCQSHWNHSADWANTWGECWDNSTTSFRITQNILVLDSVSQRVKSFSLNEFSSKELEAISKIGLIGR